MTYTYEGEIKEQEGGWLVTFPAFPGCFGGGDTVGEACENAAEALRLFIAESLDNGERLPRAEFSTPPQAVFVVEVTDEYIAETKCMTVSQAAQELGVSPGRVSQMLTSGQLEPYQHGGRRMVTIASVNDRKANPPAPHRPKRAIPGYRYAEDGTLEVDPDEAPRVKAAIESLITFDGTQDEAIREATRIVNGDDHPQDNG